MENISFYILEFSTVFFITLLAVITPGSDFVITIKNSISTSKVSGIYTALGISVAILVHTLYTLIGIGFFLSKSETLLLTIRIIGALYLIYLGIFSIINSGHIEVISFKKRKISNIDSFRSGFFTNLFNPKATIFYLSIFTQIVSNKTPLLIKIFYGISISLVCFTWFSLVAIILNDLKVKAKFLKFQKPIEVFLGLALIGFGLNIGFLVGS